MTENKNLIKPDYLSLTTLHLAIGYTETDTVFSRATGFIFQHHDKYYLITNWHNVTGRNHENGQPVSKYHAGIPDLFLTHFRIKNDIGKLKPVKVFLYEDNEMTLPKWLVHPHFKENVDVVAIELTMHDDLIYSAINTYKFDSEFQSEVGDDCFIIGYPFEEFRYWGLPIWKRASISTEPTVNEDQLPKILVDTATRPGLSGSPVIFQRTGVHNLKDGVFTNDSIIGRLRGFLGVYSGRLGDGEIGAQLGIIWKSRVIEEIINGKTKGSIEFQFYQ